MSNTPPKTTDNSAQNTESMPPTLPQSDQPKKRWKGYFAWGGALLGFIVGMIYLRELNASVYSHYGSNSNHDGELAIVGAFVGGKNAFFGYLTGSFIGWIVDGIRKAKA